MITAQQKTEIIQALEKWMIEHSVSQNDLSKMAETNPAYIIQMRKGNDFIKMGEKTTPIKDEHYLKIAKVIGFELSAKGLEIKATDQLTTMMAHLVEAREHGETRVLIGETGCGKTFALDLFKKRFPKETFIVKVGSTDTLLDILTKLVEQLSRAGDRRFYNRTSKAHKMRDIIATVHELKNNGLRPMLVFDESEYMKLPTLIMTKDFYDFLIGTCGLVIVGTPELEDNIKRLMLQKKAGMAQFHRRIKFKTFILPKIDINFELFLEGCSPAVKEWIRSECNNYGEVADVLNPVIKESERLNTPITVEFIKKVLGRK